MNLEKNIKELANRVKENVEDKGPFNCICCNAELFENKIGMYDIYENSPSTKLEEKVKTYVCPECFVKGLRFINENSIQNKLFEIDEYKRAIKENCPNGYVKGC